MPASGLGYWQGRNDRVELATYFGQVFLTVRAGHEKAYQDPSYDYDGNMVQLTWITTAKPGLSEFKAADMLNIKEEENPRFYKLGVF